MKPYTEIKGLENIVLEESYVLDIMVTPGSAIFQVDFVLAADHELYVEPPARTNDCVRRGEVHFRDVEYLQWSGQCVPPARDRSGEIDYGHIDSFEWKPGSYYLEGDWGVMEVHCCEVVVTISGA